MRKFEDKPTTIGELKENEFFLTKIGGIGVYLKNLGGNQHLLRDLDKKDYIDC
jgi:hypothetical protein